LANARDQPREHDEISRIVEPLIEEALRIAEEAGEQAEAGSPTVTVG
jgi:hypothetical protein